MSNLNLLHTGKLIYTSEYSFGVNSLPLFQRFNNLTDFITGRERACACILARARPGMCGCVNAHVCVGFFAGAEQTLF